MASRHTLKDYLREIELFSTRVVVVFFFILFFAIVLCGRLLQLQWRQHDLYTTLSQQNLLKILPLEPNRGLIYDRNGVLLAENIPVYSLEITRSAVTDLKDTLTRLQNFIPLSATDLENFYKYGKERRRFEPVALKVKLDENEIARFYVNSYQFPGVSISAHLIRHYPYGATLSHVLGYVGRINTKELTTVPAAEYSISNFIGKTGLEKTYETDLHGHVGYQQVETDAAGRIVRVLKRVPPTPGHNLYLTLDINLQTAVEKAMEGKRGSLIAIKPHTGEVLAMVSLPSYEPNAFVAGISHDDYAALQAAPDRPLYNRAIHAMYPPASTVKPYIALGALTYNIVTPEHTIWDPGFYKIKNNNHMYHDWNWKHGGHGTVNVSTAVMVSCDTYFFDLAYHLGIARLTGILKHFGFGAPTGIDMPNELGGLLPSTHWKLRTLGQHWYKGDTINCGIGQGFMLATPIQLATAISSLANHGVRMQPHLLLKQKTADGHWIKQKTHVLERFESSESNWKIVWGAMRNVVENVHGTAHRFGAVPYTLAAKTGTAQVFTKHRYDQDDDHNSDNRLPEKLRNHSLFVTFAPVEQPKIALAVVIEHNSLAAVVVSRQVLDFFFKEKHDETPQQTAPPHG